MRRLGAWGIDLRHRYTTDLFFRTSIHIVTLQALLVVVLVSVFWVSLDYSNQEVAKTAVTHVVSILANNSSVSPETFSQAIGSIQANVVAFLFLGMVALAVVFGFVISAVTLRPARNSLRNQKLFISNVAHELRTPLSTIKTSTEVLLLQPNLPKDVERALKDIVEELDRASEIINNLLSLNQLLRPERVEFKEVDLGAVVDMVVERLRVLARGRDVDFTVNKSDYRMVWGNASALEQVVTNIVRNSISYMPHKRHGLVEVSIEPNHRGSIVLTVADNGIGIAQQDLFHIFEPFYRADTSRTRTTLVRNRGAGLGLAIVNEIIRIHHGSIRMQSAPGKGTTATVHLPTGPERSQAAQEPVARTAGVNEVSLDFSQDHTSTPYFNESSRKKG